MMARAFAPPVLGLTPKAAHTSAIVMYGGVALSDRKLTCPRA